MGIKLGILRSPGPSQPHGCGHSLTLRRRTGYLLAEMADRTVRIGGADMVLRGFNGLADLRGKCQQGQQRRSGG